MPATFPAFLKLEYQRDGSAKSAFLAEVSSTLEAAEGRFREFSGEAQRLVDSALSVQRNATGSLDLGVDEMKAAAAAQQARAIAAREVANATALAAKEEGDYSQKARMAAAATQALAKEEEEAAAKALAHVAAVEQVQAVLNRQASGTDMVVQAMRRGTSESSNVINGIRAQRVAFTQLGQQMQDVVVQTQMGTNATTIFVQQVPQMAFALSGLEGNANKAYDKIGKFATFLAGPWGAGIFAATAVMAPFIVSLIRSGDEADEAAKKAAKAAEAHETLAEKLDRTKHSYDEVIAATREYNAQQAKSTQLTLDAAQAAAIQAAKNLDAALAIRKKLAAELDASLQNAGPGFSTGGRAANYGGNYADEPQRMEAVSDLRSRIAENEKAIGTLGTAAKNTVGNVAMEMAKLRTNPEYAVEQRFTRLRNEAIAAGGSVDVVAGKIAALNRQEDAAKSALKPERNGRGTSDADKAAKAAQRLQEYGEGAAEAIQRINERFNEQPRLVDQASQATRQLDAIIKDLSERKPAGFEKMIAEAVAAKGVIQEALVRPFDELERNAGRRIQQQALILQGRDAEANALQDIWQLEDRLGTVTEEQKRRVLAIATAEEKVNEVIRKRQEIQSAYLDATRQVRSELEAFFSGEKVDFGKIFKQLKARIMVENIFGDVLRDMDKYVRASTGVDAAVDQLKSETERAGSSLGSFADVVQAITSSLSGLPTGGGSFNQGSLTGSILGGDEFKQSFQSFLGDIAAETSAVFGAANDNGVDGDIVVTGRRPSTPGAASRNILSLTPEEYFQRMARTGIGKAIDDLGAQLGIKLPTGIKTALGDAAYGYATAGAPGAVLGVLKDIKGLPESITKGLDKAFKGAQTGTVVAGLGNALGVNMNETGAQIGGAIGSALPIPGGEIIGSIAGGLIGGLIAGIPRGQGYVTNNNVSVSANRGNVAAGLSAQGGSIQSGVASIAAQLGATVGSYAVGIGSYKGGYYQVSSNPNDPRLGRAYFGRDSASAVYDGKDAEAALRAAIGVAIKQGAIQGVRAGVQTLISIGSDIEAQVAKAIKYQGVFKSLKAYLDPVGDAVDTINVKFTELLSIFKEANASLEDYADLRKLYDIEKQAAVDSAVSQIAGSLQSLLKDLTIGNDTRSLRERETAAYAAYNPLLARVQAGDSTAYDSFVEAARSLLDIERQIYGSTSAYFSVEDQIKAVTQATLDKEMVKATTAQDNASVVSAINEQTASLTAALTAVNDNLGTLIAQNAASSGSAAYDYSTYF